MKSVSTSLIAAITSRERVIRHNVTVDWDNDNVITDIDIMSHKLGSVSVTQSLESSLPAQVRVVPGVAVAELDMSIERGNIFRYDVAASYKSVSSASSGSSVSNTITIPLPSGLQPGEVVIVTLFTSDTNVYDLLVNANTQWAPLSLANNGFGKIIQMQAYTRRVPVGGETVGNYTFILNSNQVWLATAIRIGDPYLMGISDISAKSYDNLATSYTTVTQSPIMVDVPNSTVVSIFGAHVPVSGTGSWTPLGGDTEVFDSRTTRADSNITVAVDIASNVAQGTYLKQASLTPSASVNAVVGLVVVLAPKLAGDEAKHAAWTFSELNANSPYAGKLRTRRRTTWKVGLYTDAGLEEVQIFTGLSLTTGASSRNRVATLTANDNRELLRNQWFLQNWVADSPVSFDLDYNIPTLPGLETTAIISYLLAWSQYRLIGNETVITQPRDMGPYTGFGFFASPPMRPNSCMLWAPLHGTMFPYLGDLIAAYTRLPGGQYRHVKFTVGPYVAGTERAPDSGFGSIYTKWRCFGDLGAPWDATTQIKCRFEFWARFATTGTGTAEFQITEDVVALTKFIRATLTAGSTFTARLKMVGGINQTIVGPTLPTDGAWHFYGLHIDSVAGTADFRVDNANTTVAVTPWANSSTPDDSYFYATLSLLHNAQFAEVHIHGGMNSTFTPTNPNMVTRSTPWLNQNFVPTAYIDKSINEIDAVPSGLDNNSDVWMILSDIASAEFSALYFDSDGNVHYRNTRSDVSTAGQQIQRVLTARSSLKDLQYENGVRQVANVVSVGYASMTQYINTEVYNPGASLRIPANSTIVIDFPLPGVILNGTIGFVGPTQYANTSSDGLGVVVTNTNSSVFLLIENFTAELNVTNPNPYDVYMVDTMGQSTITVIGTYIGASVDIVQPVTQINVPSIRKYDVQPLSIGTSPWIQREDVAASFATFLISELGEPRPVIKSMPIKGDPRLQLGDLHTIQDTNGLGVNGNYRLTGIEHSADNTGTYNQNLTVRQATTVARWNVHYWNDGTVWGV